MTPSPEFNQKQLSSMRRTVNKKLCLYWIPILFLLVAWSSRAQQQGEPLRAQTRLRELASSGLYENAANLFSDWIEGLKRELGSEHVEVLGAIEIAGHYLHQQGQYPEAREWYEQLIELSVRVWGAEDRETLRVMNNLAFLVGVAGDHQRALGIHEEVLATSTRLLGPEDPFTLTARSNLAATHRALGNPAEARRFEKDILEVSSRSLGPDHPQTLAAKANLAATLQELGDPAGARQLREEVLRASERLLGVEHLQTLTAKANLASTLYILGDLSGARQHYEQVLAARTRLLGTEHPDSLSVKASLAIIGRDLGDLAGARIRFEEVLDAMSQLLGEEHPDTLLTKVSLAAIRRLLDEPAGARQLELEVLEVLTRTLGAEHPQSLSAKARLAGSLRALGDFPEARRLLEEVLEARTRLLGAEHPETLAVMGNLATVLQEDGDLEDSIEMLETLVRLRHAARGPDHQPSRIREAVDYFQLGSNRHDLALRRLGDEVLLERAFEAFSTGLDALEAQTLRADFSEDVRNQYRARYAEAYRQALAVALERNRPDEALLVLERYRTQSLLTLLRWGRSATDTKIPEASRPELAKIATRYDWLTRRIDHTHPNTDRALLAEQADLRRRREAIQWQILEARRAEEGTPPPLTFEEIRRSLDPGTLMLAYSIGVEGGQLFVLDRDGPVEAHRLDTQAAQFWLQIDDLRKSDLAREGSTESRTALGRWLYEKLLAPAASRIDRAERLLILPDGPLHYLHFAALPRPTTDDPRGWQYLIEHKPIHTAQSATVYVELRSRRRGKEPPDAPRPLQWVGFGNPVYQVPEPKPPTDAVAEDDRDDAGALVRSAVDRGIWGGLTALPNTTREVREIGAQFSENDARTFLDEQATEDRARALLGKARIVHFAAHGLADPDQPMDSLLALSLIDGDDLEHNGLLQAWEIVDSLQLDADLVVLSACVTTFGPSRGGEGLISLSRAFQIAGARSVLASLWAVNDASTAELMIRFYRHLLGGKPKDEALRAAQVELIRSPITVENAEGELEEHDFSAPYHWAAFQLIGDWR